jgi:hypothetical protein
MPISRKEARGTGSVLLPLFGIVILLACYVVLASWHEVPGLISHALASVPWPV